LLESLRICFDLTEGVEVHRNGDIGLNDVESFKRLFYVIVKKPLLG